RRSARERGSCSSRSASSRNASPRSCTRRMRRGCTSAARSCRPSASSARRRRSATCRRTCPGSPCRRRRSPAASARPTQRRSASRSPASSRTTRARCPARPASTSSASGARRASLVSARASGFRRETKGSRVDTVVQSRSRTVVIGPERPFCVIGERINPTGRKAFQAQLQAGDLSQLAIDVAQQVEGGADMLDVNVGDPLADEIGLMRRAIPMVQGLTDLPLVIDSSVIEALEAGLEQYEGKALVNSVTGEDERLEAILPIVAKHGAAVIGLANDDEIPMEPERRVEVAKKIVQAAGDHGIPPEDVIIDPLAMPVGAEPRAVTLFLETLRLLREELGVNTTCGASNTSFGLPGRHTLGAAFLAVARPDERDHGREARRDGRIGARDGLLARPRRMGRDVDPPLPRAAGGHRVSAIEELPEQPHPDRVRLRFLQAGEDQAVKEARVPAGTTIFDAASWNGVAIDSTCGGHGTCKKCKVKVVSGDAPISSVDPRAFTPDELRSGWRL